MRNTGDHPHFFYTRLRAQRDRSRDGVDQIVDAFEALGDAGIAANARTIGAER